MLRLSVEVRHSRETSTTAFGDASKTSCASKESRGQTGRRARRRSRVRPHRTRARVCRSLRGSAAVSSRSFSVIAMRLATRARGGRSMHCSLVPGCSSVARFGPAVRCAAADRPFEVRANLPWQGWPAGGVPRLTGRSAGDRNGRPPPSASSQQAARARTFAAAGQAWARRTPIVAVSPARPALARLVTVSLSNVGAQPEGDAERPALTRLQRADHGAPSAARCAAHTQRRPYERQRARRPVARPHPAHRRAAAILTAIQ